MVNQTSFKPGEGGRPKGSKNKVTIEVKEFLNNFLHDNLNTLQSDFDKLDSKDRLYFIEKILKYIIPTKADNNITRAINQYEDWTEEQLQAELDRLNNK
ncbi:MAG: hypothetical protein IPG79_06760 [Saprospiraceae bacterium]|nr:hypothetical protein [Saprospiraceae bacterium]